MGGRQKQAKAQERANQLAERSAKRQQQLAKRERKVAKRTARQERRASTRQNQQLVAAEQASAAKLAELGKDDNLSTEYIEDDEAKRRKLMASGGRSAYGFSRGSGYGLGGGSSKLG